MVKRSDKQKEKQNKQKKSDVLACMCTDDAAQQAQAGSVALAGVPGALPPGRRQRDPQPDGPVELATPRLDGHHWAEGGLVAQLPGQQLVGDWLSLGGGGGTGRGGNQENRVNNVIVAQKVEHVFQ